MSLTLLQTLDPSVKFLNTIGGSPLPPITSPDKAAGFATSTMILIIYFLMDRKWVLTKAPKTAKEMKNNKYRDNILGSFHIQSTINLRSLIEVVQIDASQLGFLSP